MKIPTPDEFCKQQGFNPFPSRWDKWLNSVRDAVTSAQGIAGHNVSISEHKGKGTVYNVHRHRAAGTPVEVGSCLTDVATIDITFSGITICVDSCCATSGSTSIHVDSLGTDSANDTFTLTADTSGAPQEVDYNDGTPNFANCTIYTATNDCSSGGTISAPVDAIHVSCLKGNEGITDGLYISASLSFGGAHFFLAYLPLCGGSLSGIPNLLTSCCMDVPPDLVPWFGTGVAIGHGGTATISAAITSCT